MENTRLLIRESGDNSSDAKPARLARKQVAPREFSSQGVCTEQVPSRNEARRRDRMYFFGKGSTYWVAFSSRASSHR
jgi:hypothetical protein